MANNPHTVYNAMSEAREAFSRATDEDTRLAELCCTTPTTSRATYNAWQAEIAATIAWLAFPWYERAMVEWQAEESEAAA